MNKLETKSIKVSDIKPNPKNPKTHWVEKIVESMNEVGYVEPIVVDEDDMILAGHGRLKALKDIGEQEVDVVVRRGLTKRQKEKYMLLSNKIVERGAWDTELLKEFEEEILLEAGFVDDDMDEIFGLETTDDFDVAQETEKLLKDGELRTKAGQLWQIGDHKLIIGDSTNRKNWEKLFGDEKFDFMFTDPPYRLAYSKNPQKRIIKTKIGKFKFGSKGNRSYQGVEMKRGVPEFDEWLGIAKDFQKEKGSNVMIFENWRNTRELWNAVEKYWKIMNMVIWWLPNRMQGFTRADEFYKKYDIAVLGGIAKTNDIPEDELEIYLKDRGQKVLDSYEVILYGHSGKKSNVKDAGRKKWGKVSDHITWSGDTEKSTGQNLIFGTKPIQILVPYIKILSPRNGIIAEPFCGSGSTIIASEIMKRKCYAIELSPLYSEVILRRWEKFTGKKAKLIK